MVADPGGRDGLAAHRDHPHLDAVQAGRRHEAAQRGDPARAAPAEPEVLAHDDQPHPHPGVEHVQCEFLGGNIEHGSVRGEQDDEVDTDLSEQPQPLTEAREHRWHLSMAQVGIRVAFEGRRPVGQAKATCRDSGTIQQGAVTQVHAVELAEGHHTVAESLRHPVRSPEDPERPGPRLHSRSPTPPCLRGGSRSSA